MDYHRDMTQEERDLLEAAITNGTFTDQAILGEIIVNEDDDYLLQCAAMDRLRDQDVLYSIASDPSVDIVVQCMAMRRIVDPVLMERLLRSDNAMIRYGALGSFQLPDERLVEMLMRDHSPDPSFRAFLVEECRDGSQLLFREAALWDPCAKIRTICVRRLGYMDDWVIQRMKTEPDLKVVSRIVYSLKVWFDTMPEKITKNIAEIILAREDGEEVAKMLRYSFDESLFDLIIREIGDKAPAALQVLEELRREARRFHTITPSCRPRPRPRDFPAGYPSKDEFEYIDSRFDD